MLFCLYINSHRIIKRLAKAPIRLRICAGWSEPLLVAHTTLFEISCRSPFIIFSFSGLQGWWFSQQDNTYKAQDYTDCCKGYDESLEVIKKSFEDEVNLTVKVLSTLLVPLH